MTPTITTRTTQKASECFALDELGRHFCALCDQTLLLDDFSALQNRESDPTELTHRHLLLRSESNKEGPRVTSMRMKTVIAAPDLPIPMSALVPARVSLRVVFVGASCCSPVSTELVPATTVSRRRGVRREQLCSKAFCAWSREG